ncbi:very long chain fatty acid elongase 7 isoform X2 [Parasteatoda tepidariorum]|uniref:very long chain fatty acid elongase 7 isoform X2 n=1 Tax=Parasteatoda tepidariorum TaxID=114398 RepID=UPI001C71E042|nr:elongation of very long chain fatty acids protein 7 isoform X2 [Parasteatoda tepidariorum]
MIFYDFIKNNGVLNEVKIRAMDLRIVYFAIAIYVLLVKLVIPWVMKNRKPFALKKTLIVYNLLSSFLNGLLAYHMFCHLYENWNVRCSVRNASKEVKNNYATKGFNLISYNALLKFIEWFDTIFFALRKKNSQITHLHVIHHTGISLFPFYFSKLELPSTICSPYVIHFIFICNWM